jgi:hypothetical protein
VSASIRTGSRLPLSLASSDALGRGAGSFVEGIDTLKILPSCCQAWGHVGYFS